MSRWDSKFPLGPDCQIELSIIGKWPTQEEFRRLKAVFNILLPHYEAREINVIEPNSDSNPPSWGHCDGLSGGSVTLAPKEDTEKDDSQPKVLKPTPGKGYPQDIRKFVKSALDQGVPVKSIVVMVGKKFDCQISNFTIYGWKNKWGIEKHPLPTKETGTTEPSVTIPSEVYDFVKAAIRSMHRGEGLSYEGNKVAGTVQNIVRLVKEKFDIELSEAKIADWRYAMQRAGELKRDFDKPGQK